MTKSYKMLVLSYMLSKGPEHWLDPVTPEETAPFFHHYLTEKDYRLNTDFNDAQGKRLRQYDEKKVANLISTMPMTKWSGSAANGLITFLKNEFKLHLDPASGEKEFLYNWTKEITDYRLHAYFERKTNLLPVN